MGVGPGRTHSINTRTAVEARQKLESHRPTPESTFLHYMPFFFLINLRIIVSVTYVCASEKIWNLMPMFFRLTSFQTGLRHPGARTVWFSPDPAPVTIARHQVSQSHWRWGRRKPRGGSHHQATRQFTLEIPLLPFSLQNIPFRDATWALHFHFASASLLSSKRTPFLISHTTATIHPWHPLPHCTGCFSKTTERINAPEAQSPHWGELITVSSQQTRVSP